MTLGQKLRQAREEAGLSQRQLAGTEMTRNMLSQLEHDTARPSMRSLCYLAGRLGKSVSYFLEDGTVTSAEQPVLLQAREKYARGAYREAMEALCAYESPEDTLLQERHLLENLCRLCLSRQARKEGRLPYAREVLSQCRDSIYWNENLQRQWQLEAYLAGVAEDAPQPDRQVLELQAELALEAEPRRAAAILDAFPRAESRWMWLRGRAYEAMGEFDQAVRCYEQAEKEQPRQVLPRLERCYEALGDYRMAYQCAVQLRQLTGSAQ